jgi:tetratricopeptide (TPR) repeat protein
VGRNGVQKRDEVEKDLGNRAFASGDFAGAVVHYTRALGINPRYAVALSNRSLAYLKLKEYTRAEDDASTALQCGDTKPAKALLRRALARRGLGRLRDAMVDLLSVLESNPTNKEARQEMRKTRDMRRAASQRAPLRTVAVEIMHEQEEESVHAKGGEKGVEVDVVNSVGSESSSSTTSSSASAPLSSEPATLSSSTSTAPSSSSASSSSLSTSMLERAEVAASAAADAAAKATVRVAAPPGTAFALEKQLRALRGRDELVRAYLTETVTAARVPTLYGKGGLEPNVAVQLLFGATANGAADPATVLDWFEAVSRTKRFSMTRMLFTRAQKAQIRETLLRARHADPARTQAVAEEFGIALDS